MCGFELVVEVLFVANAQQLRAQGRERQLGRDLEPRLQQEQRRPTQRRVADARLQCGDVDAPRGENGRDASHDPGTIHAVDAQIVGQKLAGLGGSLRRANRHLQPELLLQEAALTPHGFDGSLIPGEQENQCEFSAQDRHTAVLQVRPSGVNERCHALHEPGTVSSHRSHHHVPLLSHHAAHFSVSRGEFATDFGREGAHPGLIRGNHLSQGVLGFGSNAAPVYIGRRMSRPFPLISFVLLSGLALGCTNRSTPSPAPSAVTPDLKPFAGAADTRAATSAALEPVPPIAPLSPGYQTEDERNSIEVFRRASQSTVFVTQTRVVVDYWAGTASEVPAGSGTGFIWSTDGYVVTNFHVIKGARSLTVALQDHRSFEADVVGAEPRKDIAVLKLRNPPSNLVPIHVRDKAVPLEVGQKTLAIGNPFGLDQTLTTGVVSALGREVQGIGGVTIRDMIQTDAAINPGNSGGPLLDSSGALIGMNTMIYSQSGSSAGIGFAVPATAIKRVVPQIINTGHAEAVGLGIQIDPSQRLERRLNLKGVIVLQVVAGGPAERAGLRGIQRSPGGISLGDVIVSVNGSAIDDYDDLYNTLDHYKAGDRVELGVKRDGELQKLQTELIALQQ